MAVHFTSMIAVIRRLETVREHLGHAVLLDAAQFEALRLHVTEGGTTQTVAILYDSMTRVRQTEVPRNAVPPVVPQVDPLRGRITHTTCSRNTVIAVDLMQRTLWMERPGEAIDPTDPFRAALSILTGYLAGGEGDEPAQVGIADVRQFALPELTELVGPAEAQKLIGDYRPHWGLWGIEQRVARTEADLRDLRDERRKLQA